MVTEPRGALTCRSLTLAVLADSGPFRGLLLTNLGSQSDFYGCRSPRCAYVSFINTRHFGRFWPVSWAITHHFGVPVRFPCLLNYKVLLRAGHRHSPFWLIRPVSWAIAHLFEVLERFPRLMIPEVRLRDRKSVV